MSTHQISQLMNFCFIISIFTLARIPENRIIKIITCSIDTLSTANTEKIEFLGNKVSTYHFQQLPNPNDKHPSSPPS